MLSVHTLRNPPLRDEPISYLLYSPAPAAGTGRSPLVLFLHGSDERGDEVSRVSAQGLPRLAEQGQELPFFVVAPQCPAYSSWACELTVLAAVLDEVIADQAVDPDRVCVTGLSMGGIGTWAFAARYPDRLAGVAPICGGWLPESTPRIRNVPVWTFHGEDDVVVPISQTEQMVTALRAAGGDVRFTRYPGVDHDSWVPAYEQSDLCTWFTERQRTRAASPP